MRYQHKNNRRGATAILIAALMLPLLGLLAFAVDYGFLLYIRTDLQRVADQAVIAAARDLTPAANGAQDYDKVKATLREYVRKNLGDSYVVNDSDITIGRFKPQTIYTGVEILGTGVADTVQVNLRRDDMANGSVSLYFARLFEKDTSGVSVTSTAALQKAQMLAPGTDILPVTVEIKAWNKLNRGEDLLIYGDGRLEDGAGKSIPGNWGTIDIGANSNSTNDLKDQIENGLDQQDLDAMYHQGTIPTATHIDSQQPMTLNGDTGFSGGIKKPIDDELGNTKLVPLYKGPAKGHGGGLEFDIVGWGVVTIKDTYWNGGKNSRLEVTKSYMYDADMRPNPDLSDDNNVIEGAFTGVKLLE